ncbi:hypothetical protein Vadar_027365 [Vaccinium darrowii]|uniref:Uncharacterized protein n=1 Tax=Vaccinium darrowii TaxID=229202 RepID=A0ACB7YIK6_9ERIC|nr:hypothetical protein Vadar_027365 [Vaccinium darrowii]
MERKMAIIGAGISGLLACKYALSKGYRPIVFEAQSGIGGVWTKTIEITKLQTPKPAFQFSDFPWPDSVTELFPDQNQVLEYLESYARHFDLLHHIRFNTKAVSIDYEGATSEVQQAWALWGGTGEPFDFKGGKWNITIQDTKSLSTERWASSKFVESYVKRKLNLAKFGMVPKHSFLQELSSCLISSVPDDFYNRVEKGSIRLKKASSFGFCKEGILIDGETEILKTDLVILGTGFKGVEKLRDIFVSPTFQDLIVGSPVKTVPLYRECIHARIPQLAVIGFSESVANLYTSEIRCRWLTELLDGTFKLPSIKEMEKDIDKWDAYMKQYSDKNYRRSCIGALHIWYNDQLCKDMGWNPKRKKGWFAELFEPYGPTDYASP